MKIALTADEQARLDYLYDRVEEQARVARFLAKQEYHDALSLFTQRAVARAGLK